jgi:hypothetical protein
MRLIRIEYDVKEIKTDNIRQLAYSCLISAGLQLDVKATDASRSK